MLDTSGEATTGRRDVLEAVAKSLALAAALLPAVGVLVRMVCFDASGFAGTTIELAWSAPLGQLVTTAFLALFPAFILVGILVPVWRLLAASHGFLHRTGDLKRRLYELDAELESAQANDREAKAALERANERLASLNKEIVQMEAENTRLNSLPGIKFASKLRPTWLLGGLSIILNLVVLMFAPDLILQLGAVLTVAVGFYLMRRAIRRGAPLTVSYLAPAIVLLLIFSAVVGGLAGVTPGSGVSTYVFDPRPGIPADGKYRSIAEVGKTVYLERCGQKQREIIGVREDALVSIKPQPVKIRFESLWSILFRGQPLTVGLERC